MGVADYIALVASEATDLQVFANGEDLILQRGVNSNIGTGQLAVHQGLYISGILINNSLGTSLDKTDEISVFTNKVGFGVDLDNNANLLFVIYHGAYHTLGSYAAGLLSSSSQALLTQELDRLFYIAVRSSQRFFAVHHATAGFFAQILNILSSKCHFCFLLYLLWMFYHSFSRKARKCFGLLRFSSYSWVSAAVSASASAAPIAPW